MTVSATYPVVLKEIIGFFKWDIKMKFVKT
jgi:hypothetical protein